MSSPVAVQPAPVPMPVLVPVQAPRRTNAEHDRLVSLIRGVATIELNALRDLYLATSQCLMGVARSMVERPEVAEEVLQDVYMRAWMQADQFDPRKTSPMAWLVGIVCQCAVERRRSDLAERLAEPEGRTPVETLFAQQRQAAHARLDCGLATLNTWQRQAVSLVIHQGMTPADIARLSGVSPGTAKAWVRQGFGKLAAFTGDTE